ncbi:MAG: hypothetical protein ACKPKO_22475, partial [Candidatus Fonsibacter sp.]
MFKDGISPLKKAIGVAVNSADFPLDTHDGSWTMTSPEYKDHAILLKVADDACQGAKQHNPWRLAHLRAPVYINVTPKEEQVQWEAQHFRELILQGLWDIA